MEDEVPSGSDNIVTEFNTYEDFLDSQITSLDLYYLEDEELARQLVELGYRGNTGFMMPISIPVQYKTEIWTSVNLNCPAHQSHSIHFHNIICYRACS